MNSPLHVVLGNGQIGPLITERLLARGIRVRRVARRAEAAGGPVESVAADLSDAASAARALEGAEVVYHTANPRYHRWPEELLPLTDGLVGGVRRVGAKLVALDNLYMYEGGIMREDSPVAPRSKKGALRAEAARRMLDAHGRDGACVVIGRASDFVGPRGALAAVFGERFWQRLLAGKAVECLGDPDQPHSYSYTLDVADALVRLGTSGDELTGRVWHLPVLPAEPTRAWVERFARAAGRPPKLSTLSPWALKMVGLFVPEAREVPEMLYQWQGPFVLDDAAFRARFGVGPTPMEEVVEQTIAWARETYALARAA